MGRRRYSTADPTANKAIGNVDRQGKLRAPAQKVPRDIAGEFPEVFAGLNKAQAITIALAAGRFAGVRNAWDITAEHLERAKADYFGDVR